MGLFENYPQEADAIEKEIERKGIVLGIAWDDEAQVRALAREALLHSSEEARAATTHPNDRQAMARTELFGLAALMLKTMEQSAEDGMRTHGGPVWKSFGRALWQEAESLAAAKPASPA
ncbi:MAG: hypothetical protein PHU46_09945 [Rhodocyclaceae bacterium]|nr:hypothetical protein [Rhodocyclaceae bacterium]